MVSYAAQPILAKGTVNEDAVLRANRRHVAVKGGTWQIHYAAPPGAVILTATDKVGNQSKWRMPITVVPRQPSEPVRAVHMSADAWASSQLRNGVMQMIDEGRINAVELDLKDESGIIGWPAPGGNTATAASRTPMTSTPRSRSCTPRASASSAAWLPSATRSWRPRPGTGREATK